MPEIVIAVLTAWFILGSVVLFMWARDWWRGGD